MTRDVVYLEKGGKKPLQVLRLSLSIEYYKVSLTTKDIRYLLPEQILYALCCQKQRLL